MKDLGHYTFEFERGGMKIRISAGGIVALITAIAGFALMTSILILR